MLRLTAIAILACSVSGWAHSPAVARRPVTEVKPLLIEAIDAPDGSAHGTLTGEMAAAIGRQFRTSAPINIDVKTLVRYAQEGCRRLSVLIWQEGVRIKQNDPGSRQTVEFGINYCRNGLPPQRLKRIGEP